MIKKLLVSSLVALVTLLNPFITYCQVKYETPETISRVKNRITVCVIPQVELISIVQSISNYPSILGFLMAKDSSYYRNDVNKHFLEYKEHPVVKMFDRLSSQPRMLNFSAPSNLMLYTDNKLDLRKDIVFDSFVIGRSGGIDSIAVFLNLLRDFAVKSSFNSFYQEHSNYYQSIVDTTINKLGDIDYISELESFYGTEQKSYNIVLVSLYSTAAYGNSLIYPDGQRGLYNTMGPRKVDHLIPFFGNKNYLEGLILHEFSHPFINPLTEKYWDDIQSYSSNFDSIPEKARTGICGEWQECINEFVIRAITTQIDYNESDQSGKRSYEYEKSRGVSNLDSLLEKLRFYQSNRETYPTFESYYSIILDEFKVAGNLKGK